LLAQGVGAAKKDEFKRKMQMSPAEQFMAQIQEKADKEFQDTKQKEKDDAVEKLEADSKAFLEDLQKQYKDNVVKESVEGNDNDIALGKKDNSLKDADKNTDTSDKELLPELLELTFENDKPMGIKYDPPGSGKIIEVAKGVALEQGVKEGMTMVNINGEPYSDDAFTAARGKEGKTKITFQRNQALMNVLPDGAEFKELEVTDRKALFLDKENFNILMRKERHEQIEKVQEKIDWKAVDWKSAFLGWRAAKGLKDAEWSKDHKEQATKDIAQAVHKRVSGSLKNRLEARMRMMQLTLDKMKNSSKKVAVLTNGGAIGWANIAAIMTYGQGYEGEIKIHTLLTFPGWKIPSAGQTLLEHYIAEWKTQKMSKVTSEVCKGAEDFFKAPEFKLRPAPQQEGCFFAELDLRSDE